MSPNVIGAPRSTAWIWGVFGALVALAWSYWPTLVAMYRNWNNDPNHSVGILVPLIALYLLWSDRGRLLDCPVRPAFWAGAGLLAVAQFVRAAGVIGLYESIERYSCVMTLAAVVLLVCGWAVFRHVAWILVFMMLMVPLPGRVQSAISLDLQQMASYGAVFILEVMGVTVTRQGNVMVLNDQAIAVVEACSGLRMLAAFVVVAATICFVVRRPPWQKAVVVLSSIPVAVVCNIFRLVITAILFLETSSEVAERFFHDFAGLTMMPMAVIFLAGELWLLGRLALPVEDQPDQVAAPESG